MNRRSLILGLIAAPAIVRMGSLMPLRGGVPLYNNPTAVIDGIEDIIYYRCRQYKGVTIYSPGIPARFIGVVSRAADEYGHGWRRRALVADVLPPLIHGAVIHVHIHQQVASANGFVYR
jgi:hypothetical protein